MLEHSEAWLIINVFTMKCCSLIKKSKNWVWSSSKHGIPSWWQKWTSTSTLLVGLRLWVGGAHCCPNKPGYSVGEGSGGETKLGPEQVAPVSSLPEVLRLSQLLMSKKWV